MGVRQRLIEQCSMDEREVVLGAAYYVAFADDRFWREAPLLDQIRRELAITLKTARWLKNAAENHRLKPTLPNSEAGCRLAYYYVLAVAASDGKLSPNERGMAQRLGQHLGLSPEEVAAELENLALAAERRQRRKQLGRRKQGAGSIEAYPEMLAGLVSRQAEATSPRVTHLKSPPMIALLVANTLPVFGVLFFGWEVFTIVLLYWLENAVVGVFAIAKMILGLYLQSWSADPKDTRPSPTVWQRLASPTAACLFLVPFFVFHYGIFMYVHGSFLFAFFREDSAGWPSESLIARVFSELTPAMVLGVAALFIQHGFFFVFEFIGKRKYLTMSPMAPMVSAYPRIIVLHVGILLGGMLFMLLSLPSAFLIVFVALKTGLDLMLVVNNRSLFSP